MTICTVLDEGINIYSTGAGKVMAVNGIATQFAFGVATNDAGSPGATFRNLKAIVTSIGYQAQGGYQFMHALREFIYVYVFTERVGEIVVNGLAFPEACEGLEDFPGPQSDGYNPTGVERVIDWYERNRITARGPAITISIGERISYDAFLTAIKVDIANAETGIGQFSARFNYIPDTTANDETCFPDGFDENCGEIPCA